MVSKPTVTIVGPGSLGSALAVSLRRAGYRIREIVAGESRASKRKGRELAGKTNARPSTQDDAQLDAHVIWFCVPDREIANAARVLVPLTDWGGKVALHSSGALTSDELDVLRRRGAAVASLHPLMTFVHGSCPALADVPFAVEGDAAAVRVIRPIVRDLKGEVFSISKQKKAAYHAWGAFTSPLLLALLVAAEEIARAAGISSTAARKRMLPIVRQTIENYTAHGAARAFSGPIVRGDVETVSKHLQALRKAPGAREVYLALAHSALRSLPVKNRKLLEKTLREQGRTRRMNVDGTRRQHKRQ